MSVLRPIPTLLPSRAVRAFTLLEVLMALVVFALAAAVLGAAYVNVLNSYELAARGQQANADWIFARQIVLNEPDRKKLEEGGEFETSGGQRMRWSVEITSTNLPDLFNVAFTCERADASYRPEKPVENFVLLRPTWSIDPAERSKLLDEVKQRIQEMQGELQQQQR